MTLETTEPAVAPDAVVSERTRYAIVGCGHRALGMFAQPLQQQFADRAELVGLCDNNTHRLHYYAEHLAPSPAVFTDFQQMLRQQRPHRVIVCCPDHLHDRFVVEALEFGCERVICEKPLTTTPAKLQRIREAEARCPGEVVVTFNYRHTPLMMKVRQLMLDRVIGDVSAGSLDWFLDTNHGAEYFRRWHAHKANSGGLLVHKSTHHFDMLNWWLGLDPVRVFARGSLQRYGSAGPFRGESCRGCEHAKTSGTSGGQCPFYRDITSDQHLQELYVEGEDLDGYIRDRCVFREDIDIEDTLHLQIDYGQAVVNYSLVAYAPWEGWRLTLVGTQGRLDIHAFHRWPYASDKPEDVITLYRSGASEPEIVDYNNGQLATGGHGGGDDRIREYLFADRKDDPLAIMADTHAGAMSVAIGFAGNQSLAADRPVTIAEVLGE